ncbi:gastric triacylglycerol lipase-like [Oppia nitens]|uniref:gastric triacylglycerol lipase-like n=1 Tax=Oppia nitens TaxID=1686743 RepID=UPI0023DC3AC4|nr:gastric triacylglycerol lipase-like [Oppia nitens]
MMDTLLLFVINSTQCQSFRWYSDDPDIDRNATQIISSRGFIPEAHTVITNDGYILQVFRIVNPYARNSSLRPVYIQHGLFGSSDDFLLNVPGVLGNDGVYVENNGMATNCSGQDPDAVGSTVSFVLAACGYDVWLGNNRGNRYSSRHILLDPDTDNRYWAYTVDHLSAYDVTAVIAYITRVTNTESIGYIGHSLGTSMMFQLLSTQPEYTSIIRPYIALAPVAYVGAIESLILRIGALFERFIGSTSLPFFVVPSARLARIDRYFGHFFCGNSFLDDFCELFIFLLCGFDFPNTNTTRIPAIVGHFPDGTSTLILAHLAQRVNNKNFAYYDYGISENQKLYRQPTPPVYNLSQITSRNMILITGVNDYLADPTDVDLLRGQLTVPLYDDYVIPYSLWNHADYLIGMNAGKYMNSRILTLLANFQSN